MSYNIKRNFDSDVLELRLDEDLVLDLEGKIAELSFIENSKKYDYKTSEILELYVKLNSIKNLNRVTVTLTDIDETIFLVDTKGLGIAQNLNKDYFLLSYESEFEVLRLGFADYSYTNYFMPKWSTAYNFNHSNHVKTVEPLFTDLKLNSLYIKKLLNGDKSLKNLEDKTELLVNNNNFKQTSETILSEFIKEGFIDTLYRLNSKSTLLFKNESLVYLERVLEQPIELRINGIFKNTFITETIQLLDNSTYKLKLKYDCIYDIELIDFINVSDDFREINLEDIEIRIGNVLDLKYKPLSYEARPNNSTFEIESNKLLYRLGNKTSVFTLGLYDVDSKLYIDSLDNIYKLTNNELFLGRVDSKVDLQIPRDMTYNNTKYIETTYLTSTEYLVEVLVLEYLRDTEKSKISICLKNSLNETYYLNKDSNLERLEEELFIDVSEIKKDKITFEIDLNSEVEFITITLNDFEGHYKKSNIILQPQIRFKSIISLTSTDSLVLLEDSVSILNNSELTLRETLNE